MCTGLWSSIKLRAILPSSCAHISNLPVYQWGCSGRHLCLKEWVRKASLSKRLFISALLKSYTLAKLICDITPGPFLPSFHLGFCWCLILLYDHLHNTLTKILPHFLEVFISGRKKPLLFYRPDSCLHNATISLTVLTFLLVSLGLCSCSLTDSAHIYYATAFMYIISFYFPKLPNEGLWQESCSVSIWKMKE